MIVSLGTLTLGRFGLRVVWSWFRFMVGVQFRPSSGDYWTLWLSLGPLWLEIIRVEPD